MKIVLKTIELKNWQGGNGEYQFKDLTNVSADNGRGKSRLYRAFLWCLFGKDDNGKSDFDVFTIENGEYTNANASVSVTLQEGRNTYKLTTECVQKRTKQGEYNGSTTRYYLNDVPMGTKAEYQEFVNNLVDEATFRMVTNPTYFLSLAWKDQREKLFEISNASDIEIQGFDNLKNLALPLETYRKGLIAEKNKLNNLIGTENKKGELDVRIEQTTQFIRDEEELTEVAKHAKKLEKQLKDIDAILSNKSEDAVVTIQEKIIELEQIKLVKQQETQAQINKAYEESKRLKAQLNGTLGTKQDTLTILQGRITLQEKNVVKLENELKAQREEYSKERVGTFKDEVICPIIGTPCKDTDVLSNANMNFIKSQMKKLTELKNAGQEKAKLVEKEKNILKQIYEDVAKTQGEIDEIKKQLETIVEPVYVELADVPFDKDIEDEIAKLTTEMNSLIVTDNSAMVEQRAVIDEDLQECRNQLMTKETNAIYRNEIAKLEKQKEKCVAELYEVQRKIDEVEAYNKARIDLSTEKINSMFENVQFQLYKNNLVGTTEECCIARNKKGVKIANTNTAQKIQAGLEIINVLSQKAKVYAPIFIDNRESITTIPQMNCQIINLIKTTDNEINISYE
jgi:DNA repair exonuclease SbcCD ATPase subunit